MVILSITVSKGPGYDVKLPGDLPPNECVRLDVEGRRTVKLAALSPIICC